MYRKISSKTYTSNPCYSLSDMECRKPTENDTAKWLKLIERVSKGAFGQVYKAIMDDVTVAVKQQYIKDTIKQTRECEVNMILNSLHDQGAPNFIKIKEYFICNAPNTIKSEIDFEDIKDSMLCSSEKNDNDVFNLVSVYELADGDLTFFMGDKEKIQIVISLCMQAILSYEVSHKRLMLVHGDFKPANILFVKSDSDKKFFKYKSNDSEFVVPNLGYKALIGDFGLSYLYKTGQSEKRLDDYKRLLLSVGVGGNIKEMNIDSFRKYMNDVTKPYSNVSDTESDVYKSNVSFMFNDSEKIPFNKMVNDSNILISDIPSIQAEEDGDGYVGM